MDNTVNTVSLANLELTNRGDFYGSSVIWGNKKWYGAILSDDSGDPQVEARVFNPFRHRRGEIIERTNYEDEDIAESEDENSCGSAAPASDSEIDNSSDSDNEPLSQHVVAVTTSQPMWRSNIEIDEHCSVDENTIPYKFKKSSMRMYNPKKPKKWGFKYMLCSGKFGIIKDTELYCGKQGNMDPAFTDPAFAVLSRSSQVVARLRSVLPADMNVKMASDICFSSLPLLEFLGSRCIQSVCTIQVRRFKGLTFPDDKSMKAQGSGSVVEKQCLLGDSA